MLENELDEKQQMGEMCQRLKDEVRGNKVIDIVICILTPSTADLHSELSRQNRKQNTGSENTMERQVYAEGAAVQNGDSNLPSSSLTSQQANVVNAMDSSPLIKANPSPQGTPLHTTFSGTQNFTPSTRISALNMVGDLLRKVGVSIVVFACSSVVPLIFHTKRPLNLD